MVIVEEEGEGKGSFEEQREGAQRKEGTKGKQEPFSINDT